MDLTLAGKSVFVSGASRGIGLAIARTFLAEGARVAIAARDPHGLDAAMTELAPSGQVATIRADMTRDDDIATALDHAERILGPLDAIIANVGSGASLPGHAVPVEEWRRVADVNLFGSVALAGRAIDRLAVRQGSLTMVSSIAGMEALGAPAPYAAAKAALNAATKALARDAGRLGVRINAVAPGNVLFPGSVWDRKLRENPDQVQRMLHSEVPLQRLATPQEIADVAVFLASPRAAFVTGAVWVVDGGQTRAFD